ncbi:MAG: acetylglutamate kinase [Planctomycetes bacterium]|nr:acetylglutamate kinase [Planctomycetota bacterium]
MRVCVKIGGAQLERADARAELAAALAAARNDGLETVVVHGGGNQIRALSRRLGIEDRYHDGLRVTDAPTAAVALQVLAGEVNKTLVQSLVVGGVPAVGLCGVDGGLFTAARHAPGGHDIGYVGTVHRADRRLCDALLAAGFVPTLATIAGLDPAQSGDREHLYNINADHGAGPLAAALGCDAMLFLTDVPAVLDRDGRPLRRLTPDDCARLRADGTLTGGMIPKVESALLALRDLPDGTVKIAPAAGPDCVRAAMGDDVGTRFVTA